jgi:large repetitive protein
MWCLAVAVLVAAVEPLPTLDVFLDSDTTAPRSVEVDANARAAATRVFISQWEARTGVPTSVWLAAAPVGARTPRDVGLTADEVARRVLFEVAPLYKVSPLDLSRQPITDVHDLGTGAVIVTFQRRVGEVPVFRDRLAVVLTNGLEPVAVMGSLPPHAAPALRFGLTAQTAIAIALDTLTDHSVAWAQPSSRTMLSNGWAAYGPGLRARHVLYATHTELIPSWQLELDTHRGAYAVVVSARDGQLLSRAPRLLDAVHSYRAWAKAAPPFALFDSPEGDTTPHPTGTPDGWAPAMLEPAQLITLDDQAGSSSMDPWLPAGATGLSGNNVIAYADLFAPDGRNGADAGQVDPFATPTSATFDFAWNPLLEPTATQTQSFAASTHAFFVTNWLHDVFYRVGFTETAGNAQLDNKGRGGRDGDPLLVEVNDFGGMNSASLLPASDGISPKLQLYPTRLAGRAVVSFSPSLAVDAGAGAPPMRAGAWNVTASVVQARSTDGGFDVCGPYSNASALAGKVVFAQATGPCGSVAGLDDLVADAGAVGLLLLNGFDTRNDGITVPTHVLSVDRAEALQAALDAGTAVSATLERVPAIGRSMAFDTTIVSHEFGHLLTNRLIGDGSGLLSNQSRGLDEGWSDFVAILTTLEAADVQRPGNTDWRGAYVIGGHTASPTAYDGSSLNAHYFGVRRFPYSTDFTRNALTLRHIVSNVPLPTMAPISPAGGGGPDNAEPHNAGEVWASALWEGTTRVLKDGRFPTFDAGKQRVMEVLMGSLKATPVNPTFLEARDAVLMVSRAMGNGEFQAFLDGFAVRGMGLAAQTPNRRSLTNAPVSEDFTNTGARWALLNVRAVDDLNSCDNDGVLDVGESGELRLTMMNIGARALTNSRLSLGSDEQVLLLGQTMVTVPMAEPFTPVQLTVPAELRTDVLGVAQSRIFITSPDPLVEQSPVVRTLRFNTDVVRGTKEGFEADVSAWAFERQDVPWENQFRVNSPANRLLENTLFGPNSAVAGTTSATTPSLAVGTMPLSVSFQQTYAFEFDTMAMRAWDGAQLRISVDGGPFTLIPGSAVTRVVGMMNVSGYDGTLERNTSNPLAGQEAFRGSGPNQRVTISLGTQYANRNVRLQFLIGSDSGGSATGWSIDDVDISGLTTPPFNTVLTHRGRCVNKPPVLQPSFPQTVDERTRVTLLPPAATDPNMDPITFWWTQMSGPMVVLEGDQFDAPEVTANTQLVFTVTAEDIRGGSASQTAVVVVRNVNRAPTSSAGDPQSVESGQTVTLAGTAFDADGDVLITRWTQLGGPEVKLSSIDALDATFVAPTVTTPSEVNLELNVNDGPAAAPPQRVTILVNPRKGCGCSSLEGASGLLALIFVARRRKSFRSPTIALC